VEQSLESVRNAEKATEPREWLSLGNMWLPEIRKTPKGKKPQGRQLRIAYPQGNSTVTAARRLNSEEERKAERGKPKEVNFLGPRKSENLIDQLKRRRSERERRKPMTSLVFSGTIL
jgi:hypothetical protein